MAFESALTRRCDGCLIKTACSWVPGEDDQGDQEGDQGKGECLIKAARRWRQGNMIKVIKVIKYAPWI
jgi:hypothetical protein